MKHIFSANHSDKHDVIKFILIITSSLLFIFIFFEFLLINYWQLKDYIYHDNKVSIEDKAIIDTSSEYTKSLNPGVYESQVRLIIVSLTPDQVNESAYTRAREDLVALSVPKEYLDFHLSLVIKIDTLIAAYEDAASSPSREHDLAVANHSESLNQYLTSASWLAK